MVEVDQNWDAIIELRAKLVLQSEPFHNFRFKYKVHKWAPLHIACEFCEHKKKHRKVCTYLLTMFLHIQSQ